MAASGPGARGVRHEPQSRQPNKIQTHLFSVEKTAAAPTAPPQTNAAWEILGLQTCVMSELFAFPNLRVIAPPVPRQHAMQLFQGSFPVLEQLFRGTFQEWNKKRAVWDFPNCSYLLAFQYFFPQGPIQQIVGRNNQSAPPGLFLFPVSPTSSSKARKRSKSLSNS